MDQAETHFSTIESKIFETVTSNVKFILDQDDSSIILDLG
jgi:hypothetical protein